ncbi:MAG: MnhB domain-containing protein [Acidimicrobiia bacterium]
MKRFVVIDVTSGLVFNLVLVASVYLLFAGHNQPGGGFVGGLLAGAAVALRYVAGGIDDVRNLSRFRPWTILGGGLLLATGTALAPVLFGDPLLDTALVDLDVPVLGHLKATSALPFDVGVYLVVLGLVFMIFESFGDDPEAGPPQPEEDPS